MSIVKRPTSLLNLKTIMFELPLALDVAFAVASVDPSGVAVGDALTLKTAAAAGLPLQYPRLPTLTVDDDDNAGTLSVTVRITGKRFGRTVVQDITAANVDGSAVTVAGTKVIDEFTSAKLVSKTSADAGDAMSVGIDGRVLGLPHRIKSIKSVKQVFKIASGTPNANGSIAMATLQTSSVIDVPNSAINFYLAQGTTTIAVTDRFLVKYLADGGDEFLPYGHLK